MTSFRLGSILRLAGGLTLLVAMGRVLGFGREMITARQFGAGPELDSFLVANIIPGLVVTALPEALGMAFVPAFVTALAGGASLWQCIRRFGGRLILGAGLLALGIFILAPYIMHAFCQGERPVMVARGVILLRVLVFSIPLAAIVGVSAAACNASERFVIPAIHAVTLNLCILALLFLRPLRVTSLACGIVLGLASQACIQLWVARRSARGETPDGAFVKGAYRALVPVLFYSALVQVNVAIDRTLASGLEVGAVSQFNYASVLINLPASLFAASVATVLLARFSALKARGEEELAANGLVRAILMTVLMTVPIAAFVALVSGPAVLHLFAHGKFTVAAADKTAHALIWLSPTVVSVSLLHLAVRYLNSQERSNELWGLAMLGVVTNLVVKTIFVRYWGLNGIAGGTSVATAVTACWMLWVAEPGHVKRHIRRLGSRVPWRLRWL